MLRSLGGLERQFYQQNLVGSTNIALALVFEGKLESEKLKSALKDLLHAHPVLSQRIVSDPFLHFDRIESPTLPFDERETSDWRRDFECELLRAYPEQQLHLTLLRTGATSTILLSLNHAAVDGMSTLILARDLMRLYRGESLVPITHGPAVEDRFPKEFRGLKGFFKALRFIFVLAKYGPALQIGQFLPTRTTKHLGFVLEDTRTLNQKAKAEGSNFFALFSAVTLKTLHALYGTKKTEGLSLNTPVSLRASCQVSEDEIGVFIAGHLGLFQISADRDVFDLARDCFTHLKQGVSEGRPFLLTRLARGAKKPKPPRIPKKISSHRPTVSISNLGRAQSIPQPENTSLQEIHAVSAQSIKDPFAFVLLSYGDKTFVDLQYSGEKIGEDEARAMLEGVRQNLAVLSANSKGSTPKPFSTEI